MSRVVRFAAATALVAAAGLTGPAPAYAEPCSSDTGVTVVVDFQELGGGLQQVCDAGGGGQRASALFPDNGFPLTYVQRQPGFVCRVSEVPADDPCVNTPPADAYWGLWWSDGESGMWSYSSVGVASLTIPDGGSVAFSWNGSSTRSEPGAPPPDHTTDEPSQEPEPSQQPTSQPSDPPAPGGGGASGEGGASSTEPRPSASASPSAAPAPGERGGSRPERADESPEGEKRGDRAGAEPSDRPSADPTATPTVAPTDDAVAEPPASGADSGLPVWVGPAAIGALLAVAGVATYLRRRAH